MDRPTTYCDYVRNLPENDLNRLYHDTEYGFKVNSDNELFGRLILGINQAGLRWTTILNKRVAFRSAYSNYCINKIAHYKEKDIDGLLSNKGIIRNKLKICAIIFNANKVLELKKNHGSFKSWLDKNAYRSKQQWITLFRENFKFTGKEITTEFLMSTGYLKGAHRPGCPIYKLTNKFV